MELLYFVSNTFKANSAVPPHKHNCFEFVFFSDCKGYINYLAKEDNNSSEFFNFSKKFNEKTSKLTCQKNSFLFIPPNIIHDEFHSTDGAVYAIGFKTTNDEAKYINDAFVLKVFQNNHGLLLTINEIAEELSQHGIFSKQMLDSLLTQMIIRINREYSLEQTNNNNLKYVNQYIDQYFLDKIEIKKLATQFNYSESHFRLLFKKNNGISIGHYIINKRIEYIKENLLNPNITIKEIAESLGFSDYYSFSNFLKKHTGMYPREFRQSLLEK